MENNIYYVYAYLDPRRPGPFRYESTSFSHEPFYIGKGKGKRCLQHLTDYSLSNTNPLKSNKIKKILSEGLQPIIVLVHRDITDSEACVIEAELILAIGRRNTDTGPLSNNSNGGETSAGALYSDESKALMSRQRKGRKQTPAQYAANCSRSLSDEHKRRISETQKGKRRLSDEQYAAIAAKNTGQVRSNETRALLSAQRKGKPQTPAQYAATLEKARKARDERNYFSYDEFRAWAREVPPRHQTARGLMAYIKDNGFPRVPRNPYCTYRSEWTSWNDVFGR